MDYSQSMLENKAYTLDAGLPARFQLPLKASLSPRRLEQSWKRNAFMHGNEMYGDQGDLTVACTTI